MKNRRIFWGLTFILCAFCLVFNQFGIFEQFGVWTVIFSLMAASIFLEGLFRLSIVKTVLGSAVLLFLWKDLIGLESLSLWTIFAAAVFLCCGLSILFQPFRYKKRAWLNKKKAETYSKMATNGDRNFNYASKIKIERHFHGGMEYVRSDDFKRADIEAHFSGLKIYFDDAVIQDDCATLHMDVHFAGVELYVPSHWKIDNRLEQFASSVEGEPVHYQGETTKVLKLKGDVAFGSVKIIFIN